MIDKFLRKRRVRYNIEIVYIYPAVAQLLHNFLFMHNLFVRIFLRYLLPEILKPNKDSL